MSSLHYPTVLSIAGSDSIGGAGIQADIKTCQQLGVYACTAITAVTAQNTRGVKSFVAVTPGDVVNQIRAVLEDVKPDAVKIGMIPTAECVRAVARELEHAKCPNIVVDPVMVATSGDALTSDDTIAALREQLFPLATVITPNIPEYRALSADAKLHLGKHTHLLLKGGHRKGDMVTDVLIEPSGSEMVFEDSRIDTVNTHGTGCSLSSAIAAHLALGEQVLVAIENAVGDIHAAIEAGARYKFGHGHGPICHFAIK